ncbi:MAG: GAF domain-containing protein [Candidatus Acetothermia bacterium]
MTFRCRADPEWTMTFLSEGCYNLTGYPREALLDNTGISYQKLIHPSDRHIIRREIDKALEESRPYEIIYRVRLDGNQKWVWERGQEAPSSGNHSIIEGVITEISGPIEKRASLRSQRNNTPELSALAGVAHHVASTLELEPLLGKVLDKLGEVLEYDAASIMILEEDCLEVSAYRGPIPQEEALKFEFDLEEAGANREVIKRKEPVVIKDTRSNEPLAEEIRSSAKNKSPEMFSYLRSWIGVPLACQNEVLGMLTLDHSEPGYYSFRDAEVAMGFASQVGVAIKNARLYETEKTRFATSERRRKVAESLRETMRVINSDRSLDIVLETVLAQIYRLLDADGGAILRFQTGEEGQDEFVAELTTENMPEEFRSVARIPLSSSDLNTKTLNNKPLILEDLSGAEVDNYYLSSPVKELAGTVQRTFGASLATPLIIGEELYGVIILYYENPREFRDEEISLVTSFADQASLAIENARLNKKAEEAAVIEERNRMARELHDSVTQSLYSVTLFAEAAKRVADQGDPHQVQSHLENVARMSQQALKEMRLLIYQMRSRGESNSRFEERIKSRLATVERRSGVDSSVEVKGNPDLSNDKMEELYLIAQEALNNAQKHAEATRVDVLLESEETDTKLKITDDGRGFDLKQACECGGMGLSNIRERAEKIGGKLHIESESGKGTIVCVSI